MTIGQGLHFPPIDHLVEWREFWLPGFNKVALICVAAVAITFTLFTIAGRKAALVPTGVQNLIEASLDFIRNDIILQTMGPAGLQWMPLLVTLFFFIFFANIFEVVPFIQFPAPARMAIPMSLALMVWVLCQWMGIKRQGPWKYFKSQIVQPGVPVALQPLVILIEFVSTFLIRPFSLAVRLFANMLAGHLLLVTFAVLCAALWSQNFLIAILPFTFVTLVALTGFEVLVAVLQAFIFTILTAVFLDSAMHAHH